MRCVSVLGQLVKHGCFCHCCHTTTSDLANIVTCAAMPCVLVCVMPCGVYTGCAWRPSTPGLVHSRQSLNTPPLPKAPPGQLRDQVPPQRTRQQPNPSGRHGDGRAVLRWRYDLSLCRHASGGSVGHVGGQLACSVAEALGGLQRG